MKDDEEDSASPLNESGVKGGVLSRFSEAVEMLLLLENSEREDIEIDM